MIPTVPLHVLIVKQDMEKTQQGQGNFLTSLISLHFIVLLIFIAQRNKWFLVSFQQKMKIREQL